MEPEQTLAELRAFVTEIVIVIQNPNFSVSAKHEPRDTFK